MPYPLRITGKFDISPAQLERLQWRLNVLHTGSPRLPQDGPVNQLLELAHHSLRHQPPMILTVEVETSGRLNLLGINYAGQHYSLKKD